MSTVKISQLANLPSIAANTSNTLFLGVDTPSGITGKFTATTLAQQLFANNILTVGVNQQNLPNTVAQFSFPGDSYIQTNLVNTNDGGSADIVVTANVSSGGTDSTNFIDMGWVNKNYQPGSEFNNIGTAVRPNDGYLYTQGTAGQPYGNLIIGTTSSTAQLKFIVGGGQSSNIVARMTSTGLVLNTQSSITFSDGTTQTTAPATNNYSIASFSTANSAQANTIYTQGVDASQNANIVILQALTANAGGLNTANANISLLFGISSTQNANNTLSFSYINSANANIAYLQTINNTQNTNLQSAWNLANTALQNTTGTFAGSLTFTGDVTANNLYGVSQLEFTTGNGLIRTFDRSSGQKDITILAGSDLGTGPGGSVTITAGTTTAPGQNGGVINLNANGINGSVTVSSPTFTVTGNLVANTVGTRVSFDNITSNNATFSKNITVLGNLSANTLLGNVFFSNITTTTTQSNSILWTTQAGTITQQTAQLWYYGNTQSLILDTDIPGDRLSISKVLFFRGFNSTGATIPANSFIRLTSGVTSNQIPYIALADATNSANATVAGFVKNAIANGAYGFAYSQGIVEDLNSTGLGKNGDILFLSTTPGIASNVAPIGTANTVVQLGRVILSDTTQGKLFIQNQLRQAYGRPDGSLLYALANNITASNSISINDSTQILTTNNIVTNTITTNANSVANNYIVNSVFQYNASLNNGTVTQLSSKSTAVTSNGRTGQITTNNAALNKGVAVQFTVNNNYIVSAKDVVILNIASGASVGYDISVNNVQPGSFQVNLHNSDSTPSGSNASDALVINYAIIRVA